MNQKKRKHQLRKQLLDRRSSISEQEYLEKSDQIISRLKKLTIFQNAHNFHCYVSLNERREVNTQPLIKELLNAGKRVVVPVTNIDSGTLTHVALTDFDDLEPNKWGVLEPPETAREVNIGILDLVIVPMVGGDRQKNRIGYGKGFYDRFLQQTDCVKVGLLFEQCMVDHLPVEPFDVPCTLLITEEQIVS